MQVTLEENLMFLLLGCIVLFGILASAAFLADFLEERSTPKWLRRIFEFFGV